MKRTPGPWIGTENDGVKSESGAVVFETACGCCTNASSRLSAEDARLIAAAPELLAELRRSADSFIDLAQTFSLFGYPIAAGACLVAEKSNRAVIAKAEGA